MAAPYVLTQSFFFDAAHTLRRDIEAEGSRRVHGHTYHCEISVEGDVDPATGMVLDLGVLRSAIDGVRTQLDHHFLDEVGGIGVPTLENLCAFIYREISAKMDQNPPTAQIANNPQPVISSVRVWRKAMGDGATLRPLSNTPKT
jgi:6-pyruvoyltetrahydropterin/6-carboxytetrahydropterin synthase